MSEPQLVYGFHSVLALLQQDPDKVQQVWLEASRRDKRSREILQAAEQAGRNVIRLPRDELDELVEGARHQGVAARIKGSVIGDERALLARLGAIDVPPLVLLLDGVQDPHNLGACLRTADAAGADAVVVPRDRACSLTPTVRKVAAGAADRVPFFQVTNLVRTIKAIQDMGIWVAGLDAKAEHDLFDQRLDFPLALVLGAEGKGLRRLTRETCDALVSLPMMGSVASLNVSVTTGICLYEAVRQRGLRGEFS